MGKGRLEAFSDGVFAIIITIMVLELRPPEGTSLEDLLTLVPVFGSYVLSFAFVGIYWMNHHHLFQAVRVVDAWVLMTNLGLLFWLSLVPFGTAWMGDSHFASIPVATYGFILLVSGIAYYVLERVLMRIQPEGTPVPSTVASHAKGRLSLVGYALSIPMAFVLPPVSVALFVAVALAWLIPDRSLERALSR